MMHTNTTVADPRPFLRHMHLASLWCQYNGQRGTERQVLRVMRDCSAADLERMLAERGVVIH
jgi:hypothetical protein